jgi:hypothetical protein
MSNHFAAIGFPIQDQSSFQGLINAAARYGKRFRCDYGAYICWSLGEGIELWVQVDWRNRFLGINPYFRGQSKNRIQVTSHFSRNQMGLLDGAYCLSSLGQDSTPAFPLVFDCVDYALSARPEQPGIATAQITGFAESLQYGENGLDGYTAGRQILYPCGTVHPGWAK